MKTSMQHRISWKYLTAGLSLSLIGVVLMQIFTGANIDWTLIGAFPWPIAITLLAMIALAWFCNGLRTWLLARQLGHRLPLGRAVAITLSAEFAIAATPAGVGGPLTRIGLQKRLGIPVTDTSAMIATDIIADCVFFLFLAPLGIGRLLGLIGGMLPQSVPFSWKQVVLAAGGFVLMGLILVILRNRISSKSAFLTRTSAEVNQWLCCTWKRLHETISSHPGTFLLLCLIASVQWSCRYGTLIVILLALGQTVDPILLMLVQGSLFLLGIWVTAPGGGGSVEILSAFALAPLVGVAVAGVAVILWRFYTYYLYLIGGGVAFAINWIPPSQSNVAAALVPK